MKQIKNVWAALKPLKKGPEDHTFGPEERQMVEEISSGSRYVHEKQLQGFEALWAGLNRCCPFTACIPTARADVKIIQQQPLLIQSLLTGNSPGSGTGAHAGQMLLMQRSRRPRRSCCRRSKRRCPRLQNPGLYRLSQSSAPRGDGRCRIMRGFIS